MKKIVLSLALIGCLCGFTNQSQAEIVANLNRVDYFSVVVDHSGSMMMHNEKGDVIKMDVAKAGLKNIALELPKHLKYGTDVALSADYKLLSDEKFNAAKFIKTVDKISSSEEIFGRMSPLYDSIVAERKKHADYKKGCLILVTDGDWNLGRNPVSEVKKLYKENNKIVVHVISFADTPNGKKTVKEIAALNPKSVVVDGYSLQDGLKAKEFTEKVLHGYVTSKEVYFDFDKSALRPETKKTLDNFKEELKDYVFEQVYCEGWTCYIGTDKYNKKLSQRRANAVSDYLDIPDVVSEGNGKSYYYNNKDKKEIVKNRRVDVIVK